MRKFCIKYQNCILTFFVVLVNVILTGILFDFYYDLNDDVMMKDVMSGRYTGVPDGRNMQTLYPLGAVISFAYRMCRTVPWYGLFLCGCQFLCFYLAGVRLCSIIGSDSEAGTGRVRLFSFFGKRGSRAAALILLSLFQWSIALTHVVNIQYTITCAMMSAAAIFWFVTTKEGLSVRQFIVANIPAMVLVVLAYQLRTEMLLLTFPFIGLAGLFRWAEEERIFAKDNLIKYGAVLGAMLAGMLLSQGIDFAAYGSGEWKDFREFFDARTTVYDFYPEVITDDAYSALLEEIGVDKRQLTLLRNYNFGLDETIDTKLLQAVAEYAAGTVGASRDWAAILKKQSVFYVYRTFHGGDAPYNIIVLWAYAAVILAFCTGKKKKPALLWQPVLLFVMRSAVWMFILARGRDPERITHSLYLVEAALLLAMFVRQLSLRGAQGGMMRGMAFLYVSVMAAAFPGSISDTLADQRQREAVNESRRAIEEYCRARYDNFYFEDVYSTVSFSEKIFEKNTTEPSNYDIMGGWMCKSPLYRQKLAHFQLQAMDEALLVDDHVFFIMSDAEAKEQGFDWIINHYAAQGINVTVEQTERIDDSYAVYRVNCAEEYYTGG